MQNKNTLITLWTMLILGMILHFNYHIGGIFYGIDVVKHGYNGKEPNSIFVIRNLFYHLPVVWILVILYANKRWTSFCLFIISVLYLLAHAGHLFGELRNDTPNPSQVSLLILLFIVAVLLVREHFMGWKKHPRS